MSSCLGIESVEDCSPREVWGHHDAAGIRNIADVPEEFRDIEGFRTRFQSMLSTGCIWIKTLFDHDDRLFWWAFECGSEASEARVVAAGKSRGKGAGRRILLESSILDAKIETAYELRYEHPDLNWQNYCASIRRYWAFVDPDDTLCTQLPDYVLKSDEIAQSTLDRLVDLANQALQRLRTKPDKLPNELEWRPKLTNAALIAQSFLDALTSEFQGNIDRLVSGWKEIVSLLRTDWLDGSEPAAWPRQDEILNRACKTHLESISYDLNLDSICNLLTEREHDIVFTLDGPLVSVPVDSLPVDGRPLFELARSVTVLLSTGLAVTPAREDGRAAPNREMFAAVWLPQDERSRDDGLNYLQTKLQLLTNERQATNASSWSIRSAVDRPLATSRAIECTLRSQGFPIVVIAGNGAVGRGSRKSRVLCAGSEGIVTWEGAGDLRSNELLLLCACLVGRMYDAGAGNVRGLSTELLVRGCRVFFGARWKIHAAYAATLSARIVDRLMSAIDSPTTYGYSGCFRVARLINDIRKELAREIPAAEHTLSAFSVFGLASDSVSVGD